MTATVPANPLGFPIVDAHAHLGLYRVFHIPSADAAGMVRRMDEVGIAVACISSHAAISAEPGLGNRITQEAVEAFPDRFVGYAVVNPHHTRPDASGRCGATEAMLTRLFEGGGFRAVKVHPELHGDYPLDGPGYSPAWRFVAEREGVLLSHTYFGGDRLEVFERLAKRYPAATILLGHCAFDLGLEAAARLADRCPNVVLDLTGPQRHEGVVEWLVARVGSERVVFGTDTPFIDPGVMVGAVLNARISKEDKVRIMSTNIQRILGLHLPQPGQGAAAG